MTLSLSISKAVEDFRSELRDWLKKNSPPKLPAKHTLDQFVQASRQWQGVLAKSKLVGTFFPKEFGGRGLGLVEESVLQEELARAASPQLVGLFGITMVGPVLLKHGTEEQKRRFIGKILSAEEIWCQGFSEPDAGSDLASLKTSATRDGDSYVISGQKVWTSFAQYADWCFVLTRSEPSEQKHKGLTYLLVKMDTPGITVRPLKQITGDAEFNEVFFDNVRVPETNIVGKPGQGWEIAISTLMFERVVLTLSRHLQSEQLLAELTPLVRSSGSEEHLARFGRLLSQNMAVRTLALSHLVEYTDGKSLGPEGSLDKLYWSESFQQICSFALEFNAPAPLDESHYLDRYLYSKGRTIAAGTSEIQRSIIAERVIGLPRR